MDGTDRRIYQNQVIRVGDHSIEVQEPPYASHARKVVYLKLSSAQLSLGASDMAALIRMLETAKERMETLGAMDAMEKIVP